MKKYGWILIVTYALLALCVAGFAFAEEDRGFSDAENRSLALWPVFGEPEEGEEAGDPVGAYFSGIETYLCDQFPARDSIVNGYTRALTRTGRWYVRGVRILRDADAGDAYYFGPDYLFLPSYPVDEARLEELRDALAAVSADCPVPMAYALLPQKNLALAGGSAGQLDDAVDRANLAAVSEALGASGVEVIDLCTALLETYEPAQLAEMYYKSDYHWNDLGAFRASRLLAEELQTRGLLEDLPLPASSSFVWKDYADGYAYSGDLARRFSDDRDFHEFLPFYAPDNPSGIRYYLAPDAETVPRGSVVGRFLAPDDENSKLTKEEKGYFASGAVTYNMVTTLNLPYIRIENPGAAFDKTAVILKDSYENACTDYLAALFSEVDIIDPRYEAPSIAELVRERHADLVLFLFLHSNVSEDLIRYLKGLPVSP